MKIGTSLKSAYGVSDARAGARWMVERARASYEAGLDSLFVGDHHGVPVPYYQNSPMLGRLLAEWHEHRGVLLLLPLWNPVLAAEQLGTLARSTTVRSCCSARSAAASRSSPRGETEPSDSGLPGSRPGSTSSSASSQERRSTRRPLPGCRRRRIAPIPPEPVAVWIGGSAPKAIDRAARLGDGFLVGPEATPPEVRELITIYVAIAARTAAPATVIAVATSSPSARAPRTRARSRAPSSRPAIGVSIPPRPCGAASNTVAEASGAQQVDDRRDRAPSPTTSTRCSPDRAPRRGAAPAQQLNRRRRVVDGPLGSPRHTGGATATRVAKRPAPKVPARAPPRADRRTRRHRCRRPSDRTGNDPCGGRPRQQLVVGAPCGPRAAKRWQSARPESRRPAASRLRPTELHHQPRVARDEGRSP